MRSVEIKTRISARLGNLFHRRRRRTTLFVLAALLVVVYYLLGNTLFLTTCRYWHQMHRVLFGSIDQCFFTARSPKNIPVLRDFVDSYKFVTDHTDICGRDSGETLPLLIAVTSGVLRADARAALRATWGGRARHLGAKMLFFVGFNATGDVRDLIRKEDAIHGDILQASYVDTYVNLTLKTVSMMKWVFENCGKVSFVLKVDDDMFVNIDRLFIYLASLRNVKKTIIGKVTRFMLPFRFTESKWYVSWDQYPECGFYPPFTRGGAYLFTGDAAEPLYRTCLNQNFLHIEDVSLTGIAAKKAGIPRIHHDEMTDMKLNVLSCSFRQMITTHGYKPEEITTLWEQFSSESDCTMSLFERLSAKTYKLMSWLN